MARKAFTVLTFLALSAAGADIPFDPTRGLVEVAVTIDGRVKGTFGIDTGADRLYVDSAFAHQNGLKFLGSSPHLAAVGVDGTSEVSPVELRSLRIGDEPLYNLNAAAITMERIVKDRRQGCPDGLIGHDILRRFYVTVDYPERTLTLDMGWPDFMAAGRAAAMPTVRFSILRHLILVDVTINDSITVPMILDYCASYTTLSEPLAGRLGLTPDRDKVGAIASMSLGGLVTTHDVPVTVADLSRFESSLRGGNIAGILGASFLYRHKLTVDYRSNRLYVHKR